MTFWKRPIRRLVGTLCFGVAEPDGVGAAEPDGVDVDSVVVHAAARRMLANSTLNADLRLRRLATIAPPLHPGPECDASVHPIHREDNIEYSQVGWQESRARGPTRPSAVLATGE